MTVGWLSVTRLVMRGWWLGLALCLACGCRSSEPATRAKPRLEDSRTDALGAAEVEREIRKVANQFGDCYAFERRQLNSGDLSNYVLQIRVPNTGGAPEVNVVKATIEGQGTLEECVVRVLARLRFPKHPGERITLNVPIQGPR